MKLFLSQFVLHATNNVFARMPKRMAMPKTCFLANSITLTQGTTTIPAKTSKNKQNLQKRTAIQQERGVEFDPGECFYRHESQTGRDLGLLAASLNKSKTGSLRVLDAMCGCGIRALRYLVHANADFVWANDANEENRDTILQNLSSVTAKESWYVGHNDANRVLAERYLERDLYDLIDIDSFGSDSFFLGSALSAIKYGGLMYLTSTDGFSSGGHRPDNSLASYGAYIRRVPYSNEIGLRMLIAGALREAATRGMDVWPVFSYYSYHGPVFRVMLQVKRGRPKRNRHYGFISYCNYCGNSRSLSWHDLGKSSCACSPQKGGQSVSGPLWTGPLHNATILQEMIQLAELWGWTTEGKCSSSKENAHLKKVLDLMLEESDDRLQCGYIKLDEISHRGRFNIPSRQVMIDLIKKEGYAASRSHIAAAAIKTNCPMTLCVNLASMNADKSTKKHASLND